MVHLLKRVVLLYTAVYSLSSKKRRCDTSYSTANLQTYIQNHGASNVDAADQLLFINNCIQQLAAMREWPTYRTPLNINLIAPFDTGTVTLAASTTVDDLSTGDWSGETEMARQEFYTSEDSSRVYTIASVTDADTLVLDSAYIGDTGSTKTYEIRYVSYPLPSAFDHITGPLWLQGGLELMADVVSPGELRGMRLSNVGTATLPTHIAFDKGGAGQASTHNLLVHPAPSATAIIRGYYQARPVTATALVDPDWPERYLGLLHELLRINISTADSGRGGSLEYAKFEQRVEEAYQRDVQRKVPYKIRPRGGRGVIQDAQALLSRITITGDPG